MNENNQLPKPIAIIIGITTSLITFITAIVGFVLLWKGNEEIVSKVVLSIGVIGLWASFLYIRFAKKPSHSKRKNPSFAFQDKYRSYALAGIFFLPILTFTGIQYNNYTIQQKEDAITVLVVEFDGADPQQYGVSQFLTERVREGTNGLNDVRVVTLEEVITATQGFQKAVEIGKKNSADIVVWGWYVVSDAGINVTYHVVELSFDTTLGQTIPVDLKVNLSAPREQVNTFEFQSNQLSDNIIFDVQRSIFHVYQTQNKNEQDNLEVVEKAISLLKDHKSSFDNYEILYSSVLSARANIYASLYGFKKGIEESDKAILISPSFDTYLNRGALYFAHRDYDLAIENYRKSLEYPLVGDSSYSSAYGGIGEVYDTRSELNNAIDIYTEGINKTSECTVQNGCFLLYYHRGLDYLQVGEKANAEKDFAKVKVILNDPVFSRNIDNYLASFP